MISRLPLSTKAKSRSTRVQPPLKRRRLAALPAENRAPLLPHLAHQQFSIRILLQIILVQKMVYWNTVIPYSLLILSKAAQLPVSQTPAAFHLRSYLVKARAIHRSIHSQTLHLLGRKITTCTIMIETVIRALRSRPERSLHYQR